MNDIDNSTHTPGRRKIRFTGGQLTTIILAAVFVAALPGTAHAIDAFTNVVITDPNGAQASVSDDGRVAVDARPAGVPFRVLAAYTRPRSGDLQLVGSSRNLTTTELMVTNAGTAKAVFRVQEGTICDVPTYGRLMYAGVDLGLFVAGPGSGATYPLNPPETFTSATACPGGTVVGVGYSIDLLTNPRSEADITLLGTTSGAILKG